MKNIITTFVLSFWYLVSLTAQNNTNLLEGKLVNVNYTYSLHDINYCGFYEFKIFKSTPLDNEDLQLLKNKYENTEFFNEQISENNFLKVASMIRFTWGKEKIVCINYSLVNGAGVKQKLLFNNISVPILDNIKETLNLSNDAFWQFYNKENNPKYPEINKLKPLVKDANGVLNIEKLAQVIKENKASLSKYLDE